MAINIDIGGVFLTWMKSGIFWIILTFLLTFSAVLILWWRKRVKLKYFVLEIIPFGNGKIGINKLKAGLFKKYSSFFGLWDYGNENIFKTNDGRRILECTNADVHDIFGKKGFIVERKSDDPKILVPLVKFKTKNREILSEIAPADFRDASLSIIEGAKKETQGWAEKYLPYILLGGIIIFFVISMILATQFFNRTVDKAGQILLEAGRQAGNIAPGGSP